MATPFTFDDRQRKMTRIDVTETSGVERPAHLVEGWIVMKSASQSDVNALFGHEHRPDANYLEGQTLEAARLYGTDDLHADHELPIAKDRFLGKSACGCIYMRTPETVAKAESDAWVASKQEAMTKGSGGWSADDVAYFEAETKKLRA